MWLTLGLLAFVCGAIVNVAQGAPQGELPIISEPGHKVVVWQIGIQHDGIKVPAGVEERFWKVDVSDNNIREMYVEKTSSVYDHVWEENVLENQKQAAKWMASLKMCEAALKTRKADFDKLVAEKFDAVVVDDLYNPCGLLHTGLQRSIFVYWSMTHMRTESAWANQSPSPPSYIPVPGSGYTDEMNFWQRSNNMLQYLKTIYIHQRIVLRRLDQVFQKYYPGVHEAFYMERNASINYVNTPPIFDFTRPYMPRVQFVGSLHCQNATALPKGALADFVNGAKEGFVYINMGQAVQWKRAPQKIIDYFTATFRAVPKVKFVWAYDGNSIKDLPKNVYTAASVPQQDVLGHENCKGFVTGGELNDVVESMFHNTPIIGVPMYSEYKDNIIRATDRDAGVILDKHLLTDKTLVKAVRKITTEQKYIEGAFNFHTLIHDVPYTELNHAIFWVEFIIRHQEVPQARSGADDLNIFQYFLVDVIAFLAACVFLFLTVVYYTIKFTFKAIFWVLGKIWTILFGSKSTSQSKKKTE